MAKTRRPQADSAPEPERVSVQYVSIADETRRRYLNYAMSVIQSRALPDARDGLKPAQRRILYAMYNDLRLTPDAQRRKCQKICGDTTGNYHPHGDDAVYETLVRMAQDFTFREPLVDGQGNFGSNSGFPAAARRYTEARLTAIATELMSELRFQTVDFRNNYDNTRQEPVVFPARFPHLVVNGTQGIAVGLATSIPPHNLGEIIKACIRLIENPRLSVAELTRTIKGPDFPLGGRCVTDKADLQKMYETGRGSIRIRGEWSLEKPAQPRGNPRIAITSVPPDVATVPLLETIGALAETRKLPQLQAVVNESSLEHPIRLVLEIRDNSDAEAVMAYLFRHTSLEQNFSYNATCLIPDEKGVLIPRLLSVAEMLQHFLSFRLTTVRRRFQYLLDQLRRRIHILEGFAIIFDGLDKALKLIRASQGKADAAQKLMAAFPLDAEQTNAILELALYRISSLEIDDIRAELAEKSKEARRLEGILKSETKLWSVIREELEELDKTYATKRRTQVGSSEEIQEFDASAYIVRENTNVVLTRDAWIKRVGRLQSLEKTRTREGDAVISVCPGSTLDHAIFFGSDGTAFTLPIDQIPPSTGYGEPLSKHVRLKDGVSILTAITTDERFTEADYEIIGSTETGPLLLIATASGQVMRLPLAPFRVASTKAGRRYCRLRSDDRVVACELIRGHETAFLISRQARLIHFSLDDVPILNGPGIGVRGLRMESSDELLGLRLLSTPSDSLRVINENDRELAFGQAKYTVTSRGGKGWKTSQRTSLKAIVQPPIELVDWATLEAEG